MVEINTSAFKFKNIRKVQRNRHIEGVLGAELGFDDGTTLWILAATDANPRWKEMGDEFMNELRRLARTNADEERSKEFLAEWYPRLFIRDWKCFDENDRPITYSLEAGQAYLMLSDDAIPAIREMINDTKRFRGGRIEVLSKNVGNSLAGTPDTQ